MMETIKSTIKASYEQETPKSIQIQLLSGTKIWLPKRYIDSQYCYDRKIQQDFVIENYILKKIGFRLERD